MQALFLIFGAVTVAWSAVILVWLPDVPAKARFLSEAERAAAVIRVNDNMTGIRNDEFKWYQVREALLDVKTWLMFIFQFAAAIANGASNVRVPMPRAVICLCSNRCLPSFLRF